MAAPVIEKSQQAKRAFTLLPTPAGIQQTRKVPRVSDIAVSAPVVEAEHFFPAPPAVKTNLGRPPVVIGFDIETHEWTRKSGRELHLGQFGWHTFDNEDDLNFARIVQLGWVIGESRRDANVTEKVSLVRPDAFQISAKAVAVHRISQDEAAQKGADIKDVLTEFVRDVSKACSQGARICARLFEFDAGVILAELRRCGLQDLESEWHGIARNCGYCIMDPEAGKWIMQCCGENAGLTRTAGIMKLTDVMTRLGLERQHSDLMRQNHDSAI